MERSIVTACVIIIGDEVLSGRTQDLNLAFLARALNEAGIRVAEARVIPDTQEAIVTTLNTCRVRFDYVFTTGGIGPTHDDVTAESVARAFGVAVLIAFIGSRIPPGATTTEARARMATSAGVALAIATALTIYSFAVYIYRYRGLFSERGAR